MIFLSGFTARKCRSVLWESSLNTPHAILAGDFADQAGMKDFAKGFISKTRFLQSTLRTRALMVITPLLATAMRLPSGEQAMAVRWSACV